MSFTRENANGGRGTNGGGPPLGRGSSLIDELVAEPQKFDFFQAVQLLQRLERGDAAEGRRAGRVHEPIRFRAYPSTVFPASAIHDLLPGGDGLPAEMTVTFLGLTGPSGVLPRHYTELLLRLERQFRGPNKHALRDWLDQFNDRLTWLFYRSWEKYRFYVPYSRREYERNEPDSFTRTLLSLVGLGMPALRNRLRVSAREPRGGASGEKQLAQVNDLSLVRYGGLLAQRKRSASNLKQMLEDYFRLPVSIRQFQGQWLTLDEANQTRLCLKTPSGFGRRASFETEPSLGRAGGNRQLGLDAVVGCRVWDLQSKFRVRLGPLDYRQFVEFLPDRTPSPKRKGLYLLCHLVRFFAGPHLDFDVQLVLRGREVPRCRVSGSPEKASRLGWNTWLSSKPAERDADDVTLAAQEGRWVHGSDG